MSKFGKRLIESASDLLAHFRSGGKWDEHITASGTTVMTQVEAVHPGEALYEDFMKPEGLKAGVLARRLRVPRTRIERLTACTTPVSYDTALRLAKYFGTTPQFWINMQADFDLKNIALKIRPDLDKIKDHTWKSQP